MIWYVIMWPFKKKRLSQKQSYKKIPKDGIIMYHNALNENNRFSVLDHTSSFSLMNGTIYDLKDKVLYYFVCNNRYRGGKRIEVSINSITDHNYHVLAHSNFINRKISFEEAYKYAIIAITAISKPLESEDEYYSSEDESSEDVKELQD